MVWIHVKDKSPANKGRARLVMVYVEHPVMGDYIELAFFLRSKIRTCRVWETREGKEIDGVIRYWAEIPPVPGKWVKSTGRLSTCKAMKTLDETEEMIAEARMEHNAEECPECKENEEARREDIRPILSRPGVGFAPGVSLGTVIHKNGKCD